MRRILSFVCTVSMLFAIVSCANQQTAKEGNDNVVLKWYVPAPNQADLDVVVEEVNKKIKPLIGATLDLNFIDGGSYQQRMLMIMTSKEEFDLCFTSDWTNKFLPNVDMDAYLELNDLIEKNAPGLKEVIPDYAWNASTVNGKIFAVPNLQVMFKNGAVWVQKSLAEKYNLDKEAIKHIEDLEPFLEEVRKGEPGMYPIGIDVNVWINQVYEEIRPAGVLIKKDGSDKTVYQREKTPEYLRAIEVMKEWFDKGYIRQDVSSNPSNSSSEFRKLAVAGTTWKPGAEVESSAGLGFDVIIIPLGEPYFEAQAGQSAMTAINRNSSNPEKAIKLVELVNSDQQLINLLTFGVEGTHYNMQGDKHISIKENGGYFSSNYAWRFGNQFNAFYLPDQEGDLWEKTAQMNDAALKSPITGFVLDTENIKNTISQIDTVRGEYKILEQGAVEIESYYQRYLNKLDEAGMQNVMREAQAQIDNYFAAK